MEVKTSVHANEFMNFIETFHLPKLAKDFDCDEQQNHYRAHGNSIKGRIGTLRRRIANLDEAQYSPETRLQIVCSLLMLVHELRSKGPWSVEVLNNYAVSIEEAFTGTKDLSLDKFVKDDDEYKQAVFDTYFSKLHKKLTAEDWKKYPAIVEIYCNFVKQLNDYIDHIELDPTKVLPAALLFIDDFSKSSKVKGLEACANVLKYLKKESFKDSNYQQVIYETVHKVIREKDLEILGACHECMSLLIPLMPVQLNYEWNQIDQLVKEVTEDIYVETNLERKSLCFDFLSNIISIRKAECIRYKKSFMEVVFDNLELCTAENVRKLLMQNVLLTLKTWIKYCWVVWNYKTDKKILSVLLKLMYVQCADKVPKKKVDDLEAFIICVISLSTKDEQNMITQALKLGETIENKAYAERLKHISRLVAEPSSGIKKSKDKKRNK